MKKVARVHREKTRYTEDCRWIRVTARDTTSNRYYSISYLSKDRHELLRYLFRDLMHNEWKQEMLKGHYYISVDGQKISESEMFNIWDEYLEEMFAKNLSGVEESEKFDIATKVRFEYFKQSIRDL